MEPTEDSCGSPLVGWSSDGRPPPEEASRRDTSGRAAPLGPPGHQSFLQPLSRPLQPETDSCCMEIEAAQRKLQEIEDRYALISGVWIKKTTPVL